MELGMQFADTMPVSPPKSSSARGCSQPIIQEVPDTVPTTRPRLSCPEASIDQEVSIIKQCINGHCSRSRSRSPSVILLRSNGVALHPDFMRRRPPATPLRNAVCDPYLMDGDDSYCQVKVTQNNMHQNFEFQASSSFATQLQQKRLLDLTEHRDRKACVAIVLVLSRASVTLVGPLGPKGLFLDTSGPQDPFADRSNAPRLPCFDFLALPWSLWEGVWMPSRRTPRLPHKGTRKGPNKAPRWAQ